MAHNGGTGPPPPPLRLGHTARLLPHTHNVHSNVLLPAIHSPTSTASPHRLRHAQFLPLSSGSAQAESRNNNNVITLDQPRPGVARVRNEYIETPLRTQLPSPTHSSSVSHKGSTPISNNKVVDNQLIEENHRTIHAPSLADVHNLSYNRDHYHNPSSPHPQYPHRPPLNHLLLQPGPPHQDGRPQTLLSPSQHTQRLSQQHNTQFNAKQAIDTQPCSTLKKNIHNRDNLPPCVDDIKRDDSFGSGSGHDQSIICPECGRCRCEACRSSRPLPSTWICSDSYQCSAETTLDYCTCMCCVKAAFYHCCKDYEMDSREVSCADKPCSCSPHHRWMRWGCLCVLSAALPCLLFYLPMRACLKGFEACHSRCSNRGCRCPPTTPQTSTNTSRFNSPVGSDLEEDAKNNSKKKLQAPAHSKRLLDPNV